MMPPFSLYCEASRNYTWCGYKVSGIILLKAFLTLTDCWEGSPLKYLPWAATHLSQWCCHCCKHFWNSCGTAFSATFTFFCMSSISWNLHPFKADYFLEIVKVIHSQIRGTWWKFHFSNRFLDLKLLDKEHPVSWSIVKVENSIVGPKFRPSSMHSFM
jgi:hypothetical protein